MTVRSEIRLFLLEDIMNRRSLFTLAIAATLMTGCSFGAPAPDTQDETSQEQTGRIASELKGDDEDDEGTDDGPGPNVYTFSANADGFVTFVNSSGVAVATLSSATKYKAANLNQFIPVDPIRPSLVAYNAALKGNSQTAVNTAVKNLGAFQPNVRLGINKGSSTIKSFRPVRGTIILVP